MSTSVEAVLAQAGTLKPRGAPCVDCVDRAHLNTAALLGQGGSR